MADRTIRIDAQIPRVPEWLKINGSITIPLPLKSVRELAQKLAEVAEGDNVNLELSFAKGKGVVIDFKYTPEGKSATAKD